MSNPIVCRKYDTFPWNLFEDMYTVNRYWDNLADKKYDTLPEFPTSKKFKVMEVTSKLDKLLTKKQYTAILMLYRENMGPTRVSLEMKCSTSYVNILKQTSLKKLRRANFYEELMGIETEPQIPQVITDLDLPYDVIYALARYGLRYVDDLVKTIRLRPNDWDKQIRGIGEKRKERVYKVLKENGLLEDIDYEKE